MIVIEPYGNLARVNLPKISLVMNYQSDVLQKLNGPFSFAYAEGVLVAANLACQPIEKAQWQALLTELEPEIDAALVEQFQLQYQALLNNEYRLTDIIDVNTDQITDWAEGFLSCWSIVEPTWQTVSIDDGTERLVQALITLCYLIVDEEETHKQMKQAGIEEVPTAEILLANIDSILYETTQFADSQLLRRGAQKVNPYKEVGRNDSCPCGSGKKFKACCGK
ncbi:YecA family protein [Vibrio viridaestus]|uniref:Prepilin peptidase n=1 Tax=Vibrio viridaestus TaxID=2487322 RepID=A0A3N9TDC1_9VIBR|nr:SEC-C metal-binding domain-containing protein [Vibrio viridaestus]RQW62049.1 prepilin peptidase [Vibrio viridaestus]